MQQLSATPRRELGKKSKSLLKQGFLPAVLYGEGLPSRPVSVFYNDFIKIQKEAEHSPLISVTVDGTPHNVLIQDVDYDPVKSKPRHVDFYVVRMDKTLKTRVPVEFEGEASAVKDLGGILVKVVHELEIEALPENIPSHLAADIGLLQTFESRLAVKDLPVPEGVRILADDDEIVALVEPPRSEEEMVALQGTPVAETPTEVKTEQEVKRAAKQEREKAESPE